MSWKTRGDGRRNKERGCKENERSCEGRWRRRCLRAFEREDKAIIIPVEIIVIRIIIISSGIAIIMITVAM